MADFLRRAPAALQPSLDYGLSSHPRRRLTALVAHLSQSALVSSFDFCVQELGLEFDVLLDGLFDWVDFFCLPSYSLFRFLLLLDAAVQCREEKKAGSDGGFGNGGAPLGGHAISDSAAEGMLMCLEELLKKCHLGSVNQMVVVLKKITFGAMLSHYEASEEFRVGIIRCFRTMLLNLQPCSVNSCSCKQRVIMPTSKSIDGAFVLHNTISRNHVESLDCLLAFLQSQNASVRALAITSSSSKSSELEAEDTVEVQISEKRHFLPFVSLLPRRIVGSLVGSCLKAASPLVSSQKESACLVSLDIIEPNAQAPINVGLGRVNYAVLLVCRFNQVSAVGRSAIRWLLSRRFSSFARFPDSIGSSVQPIHRYYERQSLKMAFAMATSDPTLDLNSSCK
ncbi:TELO2 interacting protein 1 [Musa troglodytarum]|uniref:TELO2 interacting protein 1 n=1 Tax=Musa troglodytarum TaxID=320322 RepID=A0A9E7GZ04_9LILI|nr:TELO2 interacting protein 1 [Musa troglodytarum]